MVSTSRPEVVVVALTGGPEGEVLLRRAAGLVARSSGARLHSVYVAGPTAPDPAALAGLRALTEELGGTHHTVVSGDVATAVLDLARGLDATGVVVGVSRRGRLRAVWRPGVGEQVVAGAEDLDVLVVSHPLARRTAGVRRAGVLSWRRVLTGWLLALAGPVGLTALLAAVADAATTQALAFLALTVLCALVGGLGPAVVAALLGSLLLNYFFTPPLHTLTVADPGNLVALVLLVVVAVAVASVVDRSARRSQQADRARREADALTSLNRALLRSEEGVDALLDLLSDTFAMEAAAVLRRGEVVAARGPRPPVRRAEADAEAEVSGDVLLLLRGRTLPPHDLRVLRAFATHLAVVLERQRLAARAAQAARLEEGNRLRTALLAAVSHDLRTPLAGIKAAVTTLRTPDLTWSPADQDGLLGAIEESTDRLGAIIANLLDLSRLQTGGVTLALHEVGLDDVAVRAVGGLPGGERVGLDLPEELPAVRVDAGLLERVVANLVDNALRHTTAPVSVACGVAGDRVWLRVVDHGPGVPDAVKASMFAPFQRLGDAPSGEGVGLGLAVARGLTEAMGGTLRAGDTPGGGLTMTVELPAVAAAPVPDALTGVPR